MTETKILGRFQIETCQRMLAAIPASYRASQTGYGRKMPQNTMVKVPGSKRWQRLYVCCYSNSGTAYVLKVKDWIVIY